MINSHQDITEVPLQFYVDFTVHIKDHSDIKPFRLKLVNLFFHRNFLSFTKYKFRHHINVLTLPLFPRTVVVKSKYSSWAEWCRAGVLSGAGPRMRWSVQWTNASPLTCSRMPTFHRKFETFVLPIEIFHQFPNYLYRSISSLS